MLDRIVAVVAAAAAVILAIALWSTRGDLAEAKEKLSKAETQAATLRADLAETAARATATYRQREADWQRQFAEVSDAAKKEVELERQQRAVADRTAAGFQRSLDGLRREARAAAAAAASCRAAAGGAEVAGFSPPAATPVDLLADVLGEMELAGRELAAEADTRRNAGLRCERAADALSTAAAPPAAAAASAP